MEIFSNPVGTVFVLQVSQSKVIASDNVFVLIIANPFQDNTVLVGSSLVHCNIQCPFVVVRFTFNPTIMLLNLFKQLIGVTPFGSFTTILILKCGNDFLGFIFSKEVAELRVVKLLASGSSEKEIADRLCISRHTVDNHLRNIRERFGLHKNTEIILLYIAQLNHKPFSLANIKQYGLEVILVLVNICTYTDLKSL